MAEEQRDVAKRDDASSLRISLRLPGRLAGRLKELADKEHRSMHGQIVQAIEEMIKNREARM
jgi:predicted transcriptional regulator